MLPKGKSELYTGIKIMTVKTKEQIPTVMNDHFRLETLCISSWLDWMFPYSLPFQSILILKKPYYFPPPATSFLWCLLSIQCSVCPGEPCDQACVSVSSSPPGCEQSKGSMTPINDIINSWVLIRVEWRNARVSEWRALWANEWPEKTNQ